MWDGTAVPIPPEGIMQYRWCANIKGVILTKGRVYSLDENARERVSFEQRVYFY